MCVCVCVFDGNQYPSVLKVFQKPVLVFSICKVLPPTPSQSRFSKKTLYITLCLSIRPPSWNG